MVPIGIDTVFGSAKNGVDDDLVEGLDNIDSVDVGMGEGPGNDAGNDADEKRRV